jgi:hypothetical protein
VETVGRCWHERRRGEAILDKERDRGEAGSADIEFLVTQIRQFIQWAEEQNQGIHDIDSFYHLSLTGVLQATIGAKSDIGYSAATPPERDGWGIPKRRGEPRRDGAQTRPGPANTHARVFVRPSEEPSGTDPRSYEDYGYEDFGYEDFGYEDWHREPRQTNGYRGPRPSRGQHHVTFTEDARSDYLIERYEQRFR